MGPTSKSLGTLNRYTIILWGENDYFCDRILETYIGYTNISNICELFPCVFLLIITSGYDFAES